MATSPENISGSPRGITNTLSGFVIENENTDKVPIQEEFDDQNGARADEKVYDTRDDLDITVYGASAAADISSVLTPITNSGGFMITYAGKNWKVDLVKEAGTYNGRRRWTIRGHKFDNFPPQPTAQAAQAAQNNNGGSGSSGGSGGN